ncbi:MAG: rRNA maturation RNase YbeY [Phycisphaerales bacterium]
MCSSGLVPGDAPAALGDADGRGEPSDEVPPSASGRPCDPAVSTDASLPASTSGLDVIAAPTIVGRVDLDRLSQRLRSVIAACAPAHTVARLTVRLVDDAEMSELHARHFGDPSTTDVVTFPASSPGEPVDADLACCVDEAARQAATRGHDLDDEVLLYAVHGLLHCMGHDDRDPAAFERMHAEEDRLLTAIGVGPRFAPAKGASR